MTIVKMNQLIGISARAVGTIQEMKIPEEPVVGQRARQPDEHGHLDQAEGQAVHRHPDGPAQPGERHVLEGEDRPDQDRDQEEQPRAEPAEVAVDRPQRGRVSRNPSAATRPATPAITYPRTTNSAVRRPATGMNLARAPTNASPVSEANRRRTLIMVCPSPKAEAE